MSLFLYEPVCMPFLAVFQRSMLGIFNPAAVGAGRNLFLSATLPFAFSFCFAPGTRGKTYPDCRGSDPGQHGKPGGASTRTHGRETYPGEKHPPPSLTHPCASSFRTPAAAYRMVYIALSACSSAIRETVPVRGFLGKAVALRTGHRTNPYRCFSPANLMPFLHVFRPS